MFQINEIDVFVQGKNGPLYFSPKDNLYIIMTDHLIIIRVDAQSDLAPRCQIPDAKQY